MQGQAGCLRAIHLTLNHVYNVATTQSCSRVPFSHHVLGIHLPSTTHSLQAAYGPVLSI